MKKVRRKPPRVPDVDSRKSLAKGRTVSLATLVSSVSDSTDTTLAEATDGLCDVLSELGAKAERGYVLYDSEGSGLAEPAPSKRLSDVLIEMYNCAWWEESKVSADAVPAQDRWRLTITSAERLFTAAVKYLGPAERSSSFSHYVEISRAPELSHLEAKTAALIDEQLKLLAQSAQKHRNKFERLLCEGLLGLEKAGKRNPFMLRTDRGGHNTADPLVIRHRDMISCVLEAVEVKAKAKAKSKSPGAVSEPEFQSIRHWIIRNGYIPEAVNPFHYSSAKFDRRDGNVARWVLEDFVSRQVEGFSLSLFAACELVYHGVPLFESKDEAMKSLDYQHEDYIYLSKMGQYGYGGDSKLPYWATRYHFKTQHLKDYRTFFSQADPPRDEQVRTLRTAFRTHIGMQGAVAGQHGISQGAMPFLLQIALKLQRRDVVELFGKTRPIRWPKQDAVIEWLRETYPALKASNRRAQAIAIVAAPDNARES